MEDTSPSSAAYVRAPDSDANGTHRYTEVFLPPAAVIRRFGMTGNGDSYKLSQEWVFRKGDIVFTLYDWKSTNLYESGLLSPEEFWACEEPMDLHVGSKEPATPEDAAAFAKWIDDEVQQV